MADQSLLPPNATPLCRALASMGQRLTDLPLPIRSTWSPANCPANALPWLAWAFGVEDWDTTWSEAQQRAAIAASLTIKRTKGTIGAVTSVVAALGLQARVQEWFRQQPLGAPYTYKLILTVTQVGFTAEQLNRLIEVINRAKNVRSHLSEIEIDVESRCDTYAAAALAIGHELTLPNYQYDPGVQQLLDGSWALDGTQNLSGLRAV